jgi:hypothetical protein
VAIRGSRAVLPDGIWMPRRAPITVHVGTPISPAGSGWREAIALRDAARAEILCHCGEPDVIT